MDSSMNFSSPHSNLTIHDLIRELSSTGADRSLAETPERETERDRGYGTDLERLRSAGAGA